MLYAMDYPFVSELVKLKLGVTIGGQYDSQMKKPDGSHQAFSF